MNTPCLKFRYVLGTAILILITLAVGAAAITTQSLWMDEGNAIIKALMPTVMGMWSFAKHLRGSEIQMPLFMLTLWGWEKIVGDAEYALRAINLPLLVVMVLAFRRFRFWPLVCLTSPFVLYYVGELRPYMFQMAGSAMGLSVLCRILQRDTSMENTDGVHALLFSALFLAATSLTAAVCAMGLLLGMIIARPCWLQNKRFWLKVAGWAPIALLLLGYYSYTLMEGFRGTGDRGGGLLSMGFGFYEMIGLLGLGPGRDDLRGAKIIGLFTSHPWLPLAALVIFAAWYAGLKQFIAPYTQRARIALACTVIVPLLVFAVVSIVANFSVLGRHMSPLIPVLLLPLACACESAVTRPYLRPAIVVVLLCAGVSSVMLRVSNTHARDDYRSATRLALEELRKGRAVLWQADMGTPRYYAFRKGGMPLVNYIQRLESEPPSSLIFTDIIFINRPDIRYAKSDHRAILSKDGFILSNTLSGFEIWESKNSNTR
ncbi:MAG: hypothetical protein WCP35_02340 [Verrucomicrobiota bacterium]